jgi:hypothetical protein
MAPSNKVCFFDIEKANEEFAKFKAASVPYMMITFSSVNKEYSYLGFGNYNDMEDQIKAIELNQKSVHFIASIYASDCFNRETDFIDYFYASSGFTILDSSFGLASTKDVSRQVKELKAIFTDKPMKYMLVAYSNKENRFSFFEFCDFDQIMGWFAMASLSKSFCDNYMISEIIDLEKDIDDQITKGGNFNL